jgi:hypothetical protein
MLHIGSEEGTEMTEELWLAYPIFEALARLLPDRSGRKRRLLSCACCRHSWPLLPDERCRQAVVAAEL